ncbi:MAG: hypothetical protein J7J82_08140 [Staphylothermus sp.]|nr:hypothetical protein [Staphylothermus sp.]
MDLSLPYKLSVRDKTIVIREPSTPDDYRKLMNAQLEIWGMLDYSGAVTYHMLIASHRNGGIVLGAFEEPTGRAVGLIYTVPAYKYGKLYMYSHLAGVVPEYRYLGIGKIMKIFQRRIAIEKGYHLIEWTYDPLQSSNAYFNIVKMGVIIRKFYINYYGELQDEINRGTPTDRFIAEWYIRSPRVKAIIEENKKKTITYEKLLELDPHIATNVEIKNNKPILINTSLSNKKDLVVVEIPGDINELKKKDLELVLDWRIKLRKVFKYYLNTQGYIVISFITMVKGGLRRSFYILWRRNIEVILQGHYPWDNIVGEGSS